MILFYSDQHLRDYGSFPPFNADTEFGVTRELYNIMKGFMWVAKKIEELKPELVINGGDVFHNNEYISVRTMHGASIAFEAIAKACQKVGAKHLILNGNHDTFSTGDNFENVVTSISLLRGYGQAIVKPTEIATKDGFKIGFLPYTRSTTEAYFYLGELEKKCDLIVTHLDFEGAIYESGVESKSKINPNFNVPVVSGHIHARQTVGSVVYIGSLVQHTFSTSNLNNVGGILLFNPVESEGKQVEHLQNPVSQHYIKLDLDYWIVKKGAVPFPKEAVVMKVYSEMAKEDAEKYLKDYDYIFFNKKLNEKTEDLEPLKYSVEKPKKILRDWIKEENEDALAEFDQIMKDGKET